MTVLIAFLAGFGFGAAIGLAWGRAVGFRAGRLAAISDITGEKRMSSEEIARRFGA